MKVWERASKFDKYIFKMLENFSLKFTLILVEEIFNFFPCV